VCIALVVFYLPYSRRKSITSRMGMRAYNRYLRVHNKKSLKDIAVMWLCGSGLAGAKRHTLLDLSGECGAAKA
jgi:hypothetical protein